MSGAVAAVCLVHVQEILLSPLARRIGNVSDASYTRLASQPTIVDSKQTAARQLSAAVLPHRLMNTYYCVPYSTSYSGVAPEDRSMLLYTEMLANTSY